MKIVQEDFDNIYQLLLMYDLISQSSTKLYFNLDSYEFQMLTKIGELRYNIKNCTWKKEGETANFLSELLKQSKKV